MERHERLQSSLFHLPGAVMEGGSAAVGAAFGGFAAAPIGQAVAIGVGAGIGAIVGVVALTAGLLGRAERLENLAYVIDLAETGGALLDQNESAKAQRVLRRLTRRVRRHSSVEGTAEDVIRILRETSRSGELCGGGMVKGLPKMSRFIARHLEAMRPEPGM
ncbi:MAG: hypothetical protein H5U40_00445 [Polyangiaceae bacterium]|nr:hypothetical protein [Polyangiaceae bacterium]